MKPLRALISTTLAAALAVTLALPPAGEAGTGASTLSSPQAIPVGLFDNPKPAQRVDRHRTPAHGILLKDLTTGQTLYEFNSDRRLSPASLTKIMSALVILEYGQLDDHVTVSRKAEAAPKIHLRLRAGQVFYLQDLLKAMLITSANDACLAAAEHVGGSEDRFVDFMNARAAVLGLSDTHFSNACGFDAPLHYTTAADLAKLSEIAMQQPIFRAFVREELEIITSVNTYRSYLLKNTNRLLGKMPGVEGVKTGFTSQAGRCLIAKVSQDGKELLLVLLHANRRWNTATTLINYGLQKADAPTARIR
ncbi:MAG TPA: D-alanyl-D-alanine carboxypeptidase family protein [Nitrospiraceae bacterium]|jgi:D-alanyl-D-alanine carboxypeptidase (penicillin-binding protein 5/6)|nr:D-alanyl-D-alanine carboxypeptidase family protein [Nitrospiraceae bacterium]